MACYQQLKYYACATQENSIGQDFALYYLAYAAYMELRGNFSKADAIFQSGLERYMSCCWQSATVQLATETNRQHSVLPCCWHSSAMMQAGDWDKQMTLVVAVQIGSSN